jgi:DNA polymerase III delta prime subunit
MANKPWPGFLPEKFSLQSPLLDAQQNHTFMLQDTVTDWINGDTDTLWPGVNWAAADPVQPIVGLLDDPSEARQTPLQFLLSQSHLVVLGDSGLGKTTMLRTLIVSLSATLTPDEFHAYVLDLGGRNFRSLEALPHMGTVIYEDEESFEERIQRLFEKLTGMLEERQHILSNADATSFSDYNEHHPDHQLPFVVVFIDNIAELQENYETLIETTLIPLVRRSLSVGISFVVSGNTPNNMPGKLYSLFGERVTFQQTNSDRYMDIVGRVDVEIDDIPGRGYIRREGRVLLFHAALPVGLFDDDGRDTLREADQISQMAHHMQTYLPDGKSWRTTPDPIETLPEMVALSDMLEAVAPRSSRSMRAVLGENNNLQPALFDLKRMGPHFTIVGPPLSGKTTTLYNWVLSLAYHYPPSQVVFVLIDMQGRFLRYGGQHTLDQLPHVVAAISEIEQVETLIQHLREECQALSNQQRHRAVFVFIDNFEDFSDEIASNRTLLPDLAFLARRYGRDGLHFVISGTLDGVANDLRRRIQSANYGIGLRTAQAVEALRVMKTPTGLRNKELPVGRGYVVKSGQPTMIQVASPYADYGNGTTIDNQQEEEEYQAQALDHWIATIRGRYSGEQATWLSSPAQSAVAAADSPRQSKLVQRSIRLLRIGMRKEIERLKAGDGAQDGADRLITEKVVQMEDWNNLDEIRLSHLIRDLWMNEKIASGFPEDTAKVIADSMEHEAFMQELEASLIGDATA